MYENHMPLLKHHAATPGGFADLVTFAIATQNRRLYTVKPVMETIRSAGIDAARYLTPRQRYGVSFIRQHAAQYAQLPNNTCGAMRRIIELPSIGLVKAGFILQMCGYEIACLDVHNSRKFGLSRRLFDHIPASVEKLTARIDLYVAACSALGGSCVLWDSWCELIATTYSHYFPSAESVSAYHVQCVIGA